MTNTSSDLVATSHKINKVALAILTVFAALAMLILPALVPSSTGGLTFVPTASASTHDAIIKLSTSSDRSSMIVCRSYPSCEQRATLFRGENTRTKFGWADADAFYLPAGYNANVTPGIGRKTATGVQKLYGCNGCTRTVDLYRE